LKKDKLSKSKNEFPVVGIGASAGGSSLHHILQFTHKISNEKFYQNIEERNNG
tara:strand:+ start:663 stop:821 length:159 start_codon:yes stop_codon:yes gene_type:complete